MVSKAVIPVHTQSYSVILSTHSTHVIQDWDDTLGYTGGYMVYSRSLLIKFFF
jgi:hypothetical protein